MNTFIDVDGNENYYKGEMIISKGRMKPTGLGIMKFENGSLYEGQWENGVRSGYGRLIQDSGNVYEGRWSKDLANGYGVFSNLQGYRYEGNWLDDC